MNLFKKLTFYCAQILACCCHSKDLLIGHHQLLLVTTESWDKTHGKLVLFERDNELSSWVSVSKSIPVMLGKNGLAWGDGLHPSDVQGVKKTEGDGKSPAGIFSLGTVFGFSPSSEMRHLKMDYLPLKQSIEVVDDPKSYYYNNIVDRNKVVCDWQSSEKMGEEPLYKLGINIYHNFPNPKPDGGSAIFMHIWGSDSTTTKGCTAMSFENLNRIVSWLDKSKGPLLVQLPIHEYYKLQNRWNLPSENHKLVDISQKIPGILLDIRYATSNNFLGFPVYEKANCYLHENVAKKLLDVQEELSSMGLGLKIFDGYRPLSVQQIMWDTLPDERYVSNPAKNKGRHTRGTAVDLTLVDREGKELEMPTPFDDFTEKAHSDYSDLKEEVLQNRALLTEVMKKHGFEQLPTEWWHFDFEGWHDDILFPPLDIIPTATNQKI